MHFWVRIRVRLASVLGFSVRLMVLVRVRIECILGLGLELG